jgi:hypothetical protein
MIARRYGESWKTLAATAGHFYDERLRALPMGGQLTQVLQAALAQAGTMQVPACMTARASLNMVVIDAASSLDALTGNLTVDASIPGRADQAIADVKTACFASFSVDLIGVMAAAENVPAATIEAAMAPDDVALVKGKHVIDGFSALLLDRRAKMRQLETDLASKVGKQWTNLRFFSDEEDADDVSVIVLRGAKIDPPYAIAGFLTGFLPADAQPRCADLLARREVPPYGQDLTDEHHSFCWRAHHTRQLAEQLDRDAHSSRMANRQVPSFSTPRPLPLKGRLKDHLAF